MARKFIVRNRRKRKILFSILFVMFLSIGIGYSTLSTKLNIGGSLFVSKAKCQVNGKLYNVLKCAVEDGLALEYTREHQDSMDVSLSTEKVYRWNGYTAADATTTLNKNNVIFANHCWQMIRTTDTGGVKMIYNGEPENNQCLNTRGTHVGYASRSSQNLASNYWYGTSYTYDSSTKTFKVSGTTERVTWNETTGPNLIGKYTCKSTSVTGTCSTLYLIESYYNTSSAYVILLNSNSNYSQFGTLEFNVLYTSPADIGYMYNTRYERNQSSPTTEHILYKKSISYMYWYADSVTWGSPISNRYNLDNPYQVSNSSDYPNLVGKYTFSNETQTYTSASVDYITAVDGTNMYTISLKSTGNHTLAEYNNTYTYGDSYTDNGDGTYTINNATTINSSDWYANYNNIGANKYLCKNTTNDTCSQLKYTTSTTETYVSYISVSNVYKYSNGFTWDGSKYILDDSTSVSFWNTNDSTNRTSMNNAHYTCWNENGECTTISYVFRASGSSLYYIKINDGKSVEDALNEMLYSDGVNRDNSTIKNGIDAWYKHYMLDYDDYVEDTIFCNDRSILSLNGWNPNGGSITAYLQFKRYNTTNDLSCTNITDQYSVTNPNALLTYKVGLISSGEMLFNSYAIKTGQNYWVAAPNSFQNDFVFSSYVNSNGYINYDIVNKRNGVRPAVSLAPGTEYSDGDGSMENPYVVKMN